MVKLQIALLTALTALCWAQGKQASQYPANDNRPQFTKGRPTPPPPEAEETPIFRTTTRLVQVDVLVKGKDAPIDGLKQTDFELKDNGKVQKIAVFSERKASTTPPPAIVLPPGVILNRPIQTGPDPVTTTILLMDWLNTPWADSASARLQAIKYLERSSRSESVAVYAMNQSFKVLQDFTNDRDVLRKAVEGSHPESPSAVVDTSAMADGVGNGAQAARLNAQQRQAEITSAAFRLLARHLKGIPGRKKLIWISGSLPLVIAQSVTHNDVTNTEYTHLNRGLDSATDLLNDANVAIYPLDPRGNIVGLADDHIDAMIRFSQATGGQAFYNNNDVGEGLEKAFADTDITYTLGYYQPAEANDGDYHSISVNVLRTRPETQAVTDVRYRQGYSAEKLRTSITEKQVDGTLNGWVDEPLEATEIGIQAAAVPSKNHPGYYDVEVAVDVADLQLRQKDGRWVGSFELAVVPDVENKPKGLRQTIQVNLKQENFEIALASGITVVNQVKVVDENGRFLSKRLHLVVLDGASGKAGSVRIPITEAATSKRILTVK